MKKINELMEPVKNIGKVFGNGGTDEQPLMTFSPPGESWVEILGKRFEGVNGFEGMLEYLNNYKTVQEEYDDLLNKKAALIDYLNEKYEESKLLGVWDTGMYFPSIQERLYREIINFIESLDSQE